MLEKAAQGRWPSWAPLGYLNVEVATGARDRARPRDRPRSSGGSSKQYATGNYSLEAVADKADVDGLVPRASGRSPPKSHHCTDTHQPVSTTATSIWSGKTLPGNHEPIVSRGSLRAGYRRPSRERKPRTTSRSMTSPYRACSLRALWLAITAEIKKGQYVYYHCTGFKGKCPKSTTTGRRSSREQFGGALDASQFDGDVGMGYPRSEVRAIERREALP